MLKRLTLLLPMLLASVPLAAQSGACHPGVYQLARGDYAGALRSLSAVSNGDSSQTAALNNRGVAELLSGKLDAAAKSFTAVLELDPNFLDARFNLGIVALRRNDIAGARKAMETVWANEKSPLRPRAAYHHALADDSAGDLDAAQTWLQRALEADPTLSDAKFYMGLVLERRKSFAEAGQVYKELMADNPNNVVPMLRFGVVAFRAGFADTARRYLRMVVQQAPDSVEAMEARKYLLTLE